MRVYRYIDEKKKSPPNMQISQSTMSPNINIGIVVRNICRQGKGLVSIDWLLASNNVFVYVQFTQ